MFSAHSHRLRETAAKLKARRASVETTAKITLSNVEFDCKAYDANRIFYAKKIGNTLFRTRYQTEGQTQAFALQVRSQMSHYMRTYMT